MPALPLVGWCTSARLHLSALLWWGALGAIMPHGATAIGTSGPGPTVQSTTMQAMADAMEARGFEAFGESEPGSEVSERLGDDASWGRRRRETPSPESGGGGAPPAHPDPSDVYPYMDLEMKSAQVKKMREDWTTNSSQGKPVDQQGQKNATQDEAMQEQEIKDKQDNLEKNDTPTEDAMKVAAKGMGIDFATELMRTLRKEKVKRKLLASANADPSLTRVCHSILLR